MDKIAVLGAGAWGTALARLLAERGRVALWTWQGEHASALVFDRENRSFLPGYALSDQVEPTADMAEAVAGAAIVVVAVPSEAVRATLAAAAPQLSPDATLVVVAKGIEPTTLMLLSEVTSDVLGPAVAAHAVFLSGPSFAIEVARGLPTNLVAASTSAERSLLVQQRFASDRGWRVRRLGLRSQHARGLDHARVSRNGAFGRGEGGPCAHALGPGGPGGPGADVLGGAVAQSHGGLRAG